VCAGTFEYDPPFLYLVNQKPIGFDVTLSSPLPVAKELMVSMKRIQVIFSDKRADDYFYFLKILSTPLHPFYVFFKLMGIYGGGH
jgi:hypothetical protein